MRLLYQASLALSRLASSSAASLGQTSPNCLHQATQPSTLGRESRESGSCQLSQLVGRRCTQQAVLLKKGTGMIGSRDTIEAPFRPIHTQPTASTPSAWHGRWGGRQALGHGPCTCVQWHRSTRAHAFLCCLRFRPVSSSDSSVELQDLSFVWREKLGRSRANEFARATDL